MTRRVVSPRVEELDALPTPLTSGEREVLDCFLEQLPPEWEIYIQPHMNGLRPDFVLLHPRNGIAVYEVKDWNLEAMRYFFEGTPPVLFGDRGRGKFSLQRDNPIEKVKLYKQEIHDLYCPSISADAGRGFGVITAGVLFPRATTRQLTDLFGEVYKQHLGYDQNVLAGRESIVGGRLPALFKLFHRTNDLMTEEVAEELRSWLIEPDVSAEQRQPLKMDNRQREFATTRTASGYRRIKGPAGSGKSIVLAARAAELAKEGKRVLVVSYNLTLINYLRDLAVRWARRGVQNNVTWLNYHAWCKRICSLVGREADYKQLWSGRSEERVLDVELPRFVDEILSSVDPGDLEQDYDAVMVDEGQDFRLLWWNSLRQACRSGGEMLLVADPTQDVYGTARKWTEQAMTGAGFSGGPWATLESSYRLPPDYLPFVCEFAKRYLPNDSFRALPLPPQQSLAFGPTLMRWGQVDEESVVDACVAEIMGLPARSEDRNLAWADVVFLTATRDVGQAVVTKLANHKIKMLHTFHAEKDDRRRKLAFYKGDSKLKATTLHSFKGWEGRGLVIHLPGLSDDKMRAAAYAALTRLKRHPNGSAISVVSSWPAAVSYGKTWPEFSHGRELRRQPEELPDFDAEWLSLMAALADTGGVNVEPGTEVMHDGRCVDLDLATIRQGDVILRLIDDSKSTAEQVAEILEEQGHRALRVGADEPGLLKRIQSELGA